MALEQLGLSNYGARVYEALLKVDSAGALPIAQRSGVPTGRIYSVLSELERRELVEVQNTRPKLFRAVDPKIAIERLLASYKKETDSQYEAYAGRAAAIEKKLLRKPGREENLFWTISVNKGSFSELISSREKYVEKELLVCTGGLEVEDYQQMEQFAKLFLGDLSRGVQIKLLFCKGDRMPMEKIAKEAMTALKGQGSGKHSAISSLIRFLGKGLHIRFSEEISAPFDVIDDSEVMLRIRNPAKSREYFAVMAVRNQGMAQELKKKFLEMWGNSKELNLGALGAKNKTAGA